MSKTGKSMLMPRRVEIDSHPIDVAQRLRHLPGFLFFDSANISSNEGSLSILGAIPEYVINGDIENVDMETAESKLVPNTVQGSANAFDPKKADRDKDGQVSDYEKTVAMKMLANMRKNA